MIRHAGAAATLPVVGRLTDPDSEVLLLRHASGGHLYGVPAGLPLGPEESWEECAKRELEEETGMRAGSLVPLARIYITPRFTGEVIRLLAATDLESGEAWSDPDEFIELVRLPLSEAAEMVRDGRIADGKRMATVLYADRFLMNDGRGAS